MKAYAPPRRTPRQKVEDAVLATQPWPNLALAIGGLYGGQGTLANKIIQVKENKLNKPESESTKLFGKQVFASAKKSLTDQLNVVKAKQKELMETLDSELSGRGTRPGQAKTARIAWLKQELAGLNNYRASLEKKLGIGGTSARPFIDAMGRENWDIGSVSSPKGRRKLPTRQIRNIRNAGMWGGLVGGLMVGNAIFRPIQKKRQSDRIKAKREWLEKYEKMEKSAEAKASKVK